MESKTSVVTVDSPRSSTSHPTARAVLERELEQTLKDIRHFELRARDTWNDYKRASESLRATWKRRAELLEAVRDL